MGELLHGLRPARVVDLACGTGYWMERLEKDGSVAFGCDACEEMLPVGGRVVVGDAERLPFASGIADLVVCSLALGYFPGLENAFGEMKRVLRPEGHLAISDVHPDSLRSGWKRSFRVGPQVFEMQHLVRDSDEVKRSAANAGLQLDCEQAAYFGIEELPIFEQANRAESFAAASNLPALFLARWKKPC
ncbi:MAG TPA: class I SAM-dependent methyltransferase [Bryobacteraceae bacterium]|jgi:SAM-dependent methyltransferase|nr:class I SAM-dependent methyltransferase [Bryobacteraceae bacterium]